MAAPEELILLLPNPKCVRELLTQRDSEMEVAPEELILLKLRSNQVNLLPLDCIVPLRWLMLLNHQYRG